MGWPSTLIPIRTYLAPGKCVRADNGWESASRDQNKPGITSSAVSENTDSCSVR